MKPKSLSEIQGEISSSGLVSNSSLNGGSFNFTLPDQTYSPQDQQTMDLLNMKKGTRTCSVVNMEQSLNKLKCLAEDLVVNIETVTNNNKDMCAYTDESVEEMCSAVDEIINDVIQMQNEKKSNSYYQSYDGEEAPTKGVSLISIPLGKL